MKSCMLFIGVLCALAVPLSVASAADDAPSYEGAEALGALVDFDLVVDLNDQLCGWGHHGHHGHHRHYGGYGGYYRSYYGSFYYGGYGGYRGYGGYGGYGGGYGGCY